MTTEILALNLHIRNILEFFLILSEPMFGSVTHINLLQNFIICILFSFFSLAVLSVQLVGS